MKLLKEPPSFKPFDATCRGCGAIVKIEEPKDLERYVYAGDQRDPRDTGSDHAQWTCPVCRFTNHVGAEKIPSHIYETLRMDKP